MAYAGLKRDMLASRAHITTSTLDRITGKPTRGANSDDLWRIADACGLPREWFTADLERLWEIVPPGRPVFVRPDDARRRLAASLRERAQRTREHPGTSPETMPGPDDQAAES